MYVDVEPPTLASTGLSYSLKEIEAKHLPRMVATKPHFYRRVEGEVEEIVSSRDGRRRVGGRKNADRNRPIVFL